MSTSVPPVLAAVLLDGFARLICFLLEAEADCLCGVPLHGRSNQRTNYRAGYYDRKLRTPLGDVILRVVHLKYIHPRVSIVKRARRLSPQILETLGQIHAAGTAPECISALIKTLWTLDLPPALLLGLSVQLTPILEAWRIENARENGTPFHSAPECEPAPPSAETPCATI